MSCLIGLEEHPVHGRLISTQRLSIDDIHVLTIVSELNEHVVARAVLPPRLQCVVEFEARDSISIQVVFDHEDLFYFRPLLVDDLLA